ncbi:MAG: prolipoprotein diacylglyceryl transferase [Polyangiaceae bacterium]|nr:prolipoprotein diacylglyceryl transferase [Polyangiaceae bacterium]
MHPILLKIPLGAGVTLPFFGKLTSLPIYSYGVMLGLSIVVGWYLTLGLAKRDGLPEEEMANNYVFTAVMAILGSRVLYVLTNPDDFATAADWFAFRKGGLVAYGGFLGGFLGSYLYLKRKRLPLLPWGDVAVPSLATGLMITRIGCYLFGCDFGRTLSPSAPGFLKKLGTFPRWQDGTLDAGSGSPAWVQHTQAHLIPPDAAHSLPVHPTQLYESLVGLTLFGLVMFQRKHQRFRGQVFLLFTFAYGVLRYGLEIIRDDAERGNYGPSWPEHVMVPGGLVVLGLAYAVFMSRAVENKALRAATQALALVPGVALYVALKPATFAGEALVKLSTSQWVALLTGTAAAVAYGMFWNSAKAHPTRAMALDLSGFHELSGAVPEVAAEAEEPKKKQKKRAKSAESSEEVKPDAPARDEDRPATEAG